MSQGTTTRICITGTDPQHGYCGRQNTTATTDTDKTNCKDCGAALRADIHAGLPTPQLERITR